MAYVTLPRSEGGYRRPQALVHEDGKPVGVLTRQDLLAFLAQA